MFVCFSRLQQVRWSLDCFLLLSAECEFFGGFNVSQGKKAAIDIYKLEKHVQLSEKLRNMLEFEDSI